VRESYSRHGGIVGRSLGDSGFWWPFTNHQFSVRRVFPESGFQHRAQVVRQQGPGQRSHGRPEWEGSGKPSQAPLRIHECGLPSRVLHVIVMTDSHKAAHVALLAPVPLGHLESALETIDTKGRTAFGTLKWDLFTKLEMMRKGLNVDVYIYASHGDGYYDPAATWLATYVGLEPDKWKAAPFRPKSTATDNENGEVYWLVKDLRRAPAPGIALSEFTGFGKQKPYGHDFHPRGPLLVEHPL
jgi:hypothetical protein